MSDGVDESEYEIHQCEHDFRPRYAAWSAGAVEHICVECGTVREDEP